MIECTGGYNGKKEIYFIMSVQRKIPQTDRSLGKKEQMY